MNRIVELQSLFDNLRQDIKDYFIKEGFMPDKFREEGSFDDKEFITFCAHVNRINNMLEPHAVLFDDSTAKASDVAALYLARFLGDSR